MFRPIDTSYKKIKQDKASILKEIVSKDAKKTKGKEDYEKSEFQGFKELMVTPF